MVAEEMPLTADGLHVEADQYDPCRPPLQGEIDRLKAAVAAVVD